MAETNDRNSSTENLDPFNPTQINGIVSTPNPTLGGVYEYFTPDDIVQGSRRVITEGFFTNNLGVLENFFTSSVQTELSSSRYYIDIYQANPNTDSGSEVQFDISYAKYDGISGGDSWESNYSASKAIYSQYANILLPSNQNKFTFAGNVTGSDDIFIINLKRNKLKEGLQSGYWQLNLSGSSGNGISIIDESRESDYATISVGSGVGDAYYIVSGTVGSRTGSASEFPYGIAYPDLGILILNAAQITGSSGIDTEFTSTNTDGINKEFYYAIESGSYFYMRNQEEVHSAHYFVRAKNQKFNFSNNPTWVTSGSVIRYNDMRTDPRVYITTIGLYNNSNQLLATAKLSRPVQKSFEKELLIKIRLDY
jgi:hypothetical protein